MADSGAKKTYRRTSSTSSRASSAVSIVKVERGRTGGSFSSSCSSMESASKGEVTGTLTWIQAEERALRMALGKPTNRGHYTDLSASADIRDIVLRRLRTDEVPTVVRGSNERSLYNGYGNSMYDNFVTDDQPEIAFKLVLDFTMPDQTSSRCKIPLANCGTTCLLDRYDAPKIFFATLIQLFDITPSMIAIPLPPCIQLKGVKFVPGRSQEWASSASI